MRAIDDCWLVRALGDGDVRHELEHYILNQRGHSASHKGVCGITVIKVNHSQFQVSKLKFLNTISERVGRCDVVSVHSPAILGCLFVHIFSVTEDSVPYRRLEVLAGQMAVRQTEVEIIHFRLLPAKISPEVTFD